MVFTCGQSKIYWNKKNQLHKMSLKYEEKWVVSNVTKIC